MKPCSRNHKTHLLLKCLDVFVHVCFIDLTESLKQLDREGMIKLAEKLGQIGREVVGDKQTMMSIMFAL